MNDSEGKTQAMGYQAFDSAYRVLDLLASVMGHVRIDSARVTTNIRRFCITITELADSLVRQEGLSFRQGREIAAAVARAVISVDGDLPVDGFAPFVAAFAHAVGRPSTIDAAEFAELVPPEHFVAVRTRFSDPGAAPMAVALEGYRARSAGFADWAKVRARPKRRRRLNSIPNLMHWWGRSDGKY